MYKIGIDDNYKNNIYTNDAIHSLVIKINNNIIDSKYVRKLQKQHDILAGEKLSIGSACSQCITLQLDYDALNNIQEINEVYIEENVIIGDSTYKIPLGYFYLSNNGIDSTNKAYATLKLYDKLYTLNIPYSTSSEFIENNNKTRLQIVQDICAKNGMYLETTNFLGYDKIDNVYNDDMTYQNWLVFISERAGGFCRVGREKNSSGLIPLSIISLADLETNIIPNNMLGNFVEGNTFTISKVATSIITNYGDDTGTTIFLSADNILPLTNNDVEEIYNKIKNVTFQNFEVKTWGDSTIDAGDFIQIGDYKTIAEIDMDYANGYYGTYKFNKQLPESDTEIVKIQSSGNKRYTKKRIEELENGYKFVVQSVETLEKEVTTVKETSGNNSLYIEDALESRVLEYGIDGKSKQETRSGKNLFNYVDNVVSTNYGLTNTLNDDGSITTTGMPTTNYVSITKTIDITDLLEDGQKYVASQTTASIFVWLEIRAKEISSGTIKSYFGTQNGTTSFWADKSLYTYDARIVSATMANWGETSRTITNFYQIEKGSTKTDFEKYGVSPSPDFPSEIKSVDGIKNLWKLPETKTLNGVTLTNNGDGTITLNGTATTNADFYVEDSSSNYINGEKYYISSNINKSDVTVIFANYNGNTYVNTLINSNGTMPFTMNTTNDKVRLIVRALSGKTFNNTKLQIQLEKSPIAHPNVPYGSWLKVQTTGKNLLNLKDFTFTSGGITHTISNQTIKSVGTATTTSSDIGNASNLFELSSVLASGTQLTFSRTNTSYRLFIKMYDENKGNAQQYEIPNGQTSVTFTLTGNKKYFYIFYAGWTSGTSVNNTINVQLEKGTTATDYEQYKENISLIDLKDNELCSIGDIKDNLIVNPDGTATIEKKIGKVVLNGSETIKIRSGNNGSKLHCISIPNCTRATPTIMPNILSNKFIKQTRNDLFNGFEDGICYGGPSSTYYYDICIRSSELDNLTTDEFKTWLSENKPIVYYQLEEPYTIDLGQVDISLFENINHINLVDDIETDTRVKYLINNVMNGTYATKGELELTNEQFQTTITNEFNSLERQMTSITQTGGTIDLAIQSSKDYTDSKNESLDNRITNSENNYNDLNNKYNTLNGKITDMNFSFKTDGLTIGTSGSEINSKLDNKGLKIYNISTLMAIFNQNGSGFGKLIVIESIQLQNLFVQKRVINTLKANNMEVISFFFNKSLIENLTDLESD